LILILRLHISEKGIQRHRATPPEIVGVLRVRLD
jgi:hypothetical protein